MNYPFLDSAPGLELVRRYGALKDQLSTLEWITNGSVTPNHPGYWRWTRKVHARTVSVSLSADQAELFKKAIAEHRRLEAILSEMRLITQEILLKSAPRPLKKKPRTRNVPKRP